MVAKMKRVPSATMAKVKRVGPRASKGGKFTPVLRHPQKRLLQPWPARALRAFDLPGEIGWGGMLRQVLRTRGWKVGSPCHVSRDGQTVFVREFEAALRQQTPAKAFGKRGAVQEGHKLRTLTIPQRAVWFQSCAEYAVPGERGGRVCYHENFEHIVAKYGSDFAAAHPDGHHLKMGFPGVDTALSKDRFTEAFRDAPWYPKCYVLPQDRGALLKRLKDKPREYWITKPRNECSGAGISVYEATDPTLKRHVSESVNHKRSVVQSYVADPLLLGGYKFHMRVHLFVTSLSPPQAYVQAGGQCLCSTKLYHLEKSGLGDNFDAPVHISNTGLNMKKEQREGFLKKKAVIGRGQQILMRQLEAHLAKHYPGFSKEALWGQILHIAAEVVRHLATAPSIQRNGKLVPGQFLDILGMDLILDSKLKVWMCETNASPGLSDQDKKVHGVPNPDYEKEGQCLSGVWHDMLTLLGLDADATVQNKRGSLRGWYELDFSAATP